MKESKPDTIRNIAVLSYGGAGKTTLIEAILCSSGTIPQMGSVVAGTTAMDYDPEEHHRTVSIQPSLPIGKEASLVGVVDLLTGEAFRYASDGSGKRQKAEVPAALSGEVEAARKKLMEGAAEADDQLLEKYLGDGTLTAAEILKG